MLTCLNEASLRLLITDITIALCLAIVLSNQNFNHIEVIFREEIAWFLQTSYNKCPLQNCPLKGSFSWRFDQYLSSSEKICPLKSSYYYLACHIQRFERLVKTNTRSNRWEKKKNLQPEFRSLFTSLSVSIPFKTFYNFFSS